LTFLSVCFWFHNKHPLTWKVCAYDLSKVYYEDIPLYGIALEREVCEASPNCGGLLFRPADTGMPSVPLGGGPLEKKDGDEDMGAPSGPDEWPQDFEEIEESVPNLLDEEGNPMWSDTARAEDTVIDEPSKMIEAEETKEEEWIGMAKLLFVPVYYNDRHDDVFVSHKPWLIQRGSVTFAARDYKSTVVAHATDMSIEEARVFCFEHESCIAFSFPLQTEQHQGMTYLVDEVIFVNQIAGFDFGHQTFVQEYESDERDMDSDPGLVEWMTHILHDRVKLTGHVKKHINIEDAKWRDYSTTPYRPCCHASHDLPNIEQVKEMDALPRIPCNISRQEFYETYETTRTPVMLVGCDKQWPAHEAWKDIPTLLKRFDNSSQWEVPRDMSWGDFQDFYVEDVKEGHAGFRVFSQLKAGYRSNEISKDYAVPKPFQGGDMYKMLPSYENFTFPSGYGPMHWFIMGSYGTGTGPHIDPHSTDAWNTLVHGHKWWIIYPKRPRVITEDETKCFVPCSDPEVPGTVNGGQEKAWYSSVGRYAHKMYYGHDEAAVQVLQNAGETIYLPYGMVHSVLNMDETIAITQNYGAQGNFEEVWKEVLVSGEDMDWKNLYFKQFDRATRKRVREIMWPITKQKLRDEARSHDVYQSIDHSELQSFSDDPGPYHGDEEDEAEDIPEGGKNGLSRKCERT
jgi:hypothetical protein